MDVSIIIPCYNSGKYLREAVESTCKLDGREKYEIELIIVDDGSTDPYTLQVLAELEQQSVRVIHRSNGGPAAARNTGVDHSSGRYIVFLDSDNILKSDFVQECIRVQEQTNADIVYALSDFFGDSTEPRFTTGDFDLHKILIENYIDMCCLVEREAFERVGRLDENRGILGFEDWEFYLRAYGTGLTFHYIGRPLYSYRILNGSLSQINTVERMRSVKEYVYAKNIRVVIESINYHYYRELLRLDSRSNKMRWISTVFRRYFMRSRSKMIGPMRKIFKLY